MKNYFLLSVILIFAGVSCLANAQQRPDLNKAEQAVQFQMQLNFKRKIAEQARTEQSMVQLTFDWVKLAKNGEKIPTKTATTQCKGILLEDSRVATPEVCTRKKGWRLSKVNLAFANTAKIDLPSSAIEVVEDMAYIRAGTSVTAGLQGMPFSPIPKGETLLTYFGEENISPDLLSFLSSKGVIKCYGGSHAGCLWRKHGPRRSLRHAHVHHRSRLELGDAFVYKGRVVALVKKKISRYYMRPTQDIFALFRS